MAGLFITFEGPDGGGKTTQVKMLTAYMKNRGKQVVCTREPGGTELGNAIRELLLNPQYSMSPRTEALLYMAARAEHVARVIQPALAQGCIVISDRFADSTFVYQGIARNLPGQDIELINDFATRGLVPDITIVLDGDTGQLLERMQLRGKSDRIELEHISFHQQVRQGFIDLVQKEPDRVKLVNGCDSVQNIHAQVIAIISAIWNRRDI